MANQMICGVARDGDVWDIPTQEEVNAVHAGIIAASGGAGEMTDEELDAVFSGARYDMDMDMYPPTITEYEALTGRSEFGAEFVLDGKR